MAKAFRCTHSGLLLPPDYVENWGVYYGHGLGSKPVSECWDTLYRVAPDISGAIQYNVPMADLTYPISQPGFPIESVDVPDAELADPANRLILNVDDKDRTKRVAIMRTKQKAHPKSKDFYDRIGSQVSVNARQPWA